MYQDHQGLPRQFYKEQCSIDAIMFDSCYLPGLNCLYQ